MAAVDLSAPAAATAPAADPLPVLRQVLAPLGTAVAAERLTGGMFATTFRVTLADGTRVVAKTAPTATDRLLTYELDLLRTEAEVYALAADHPGLLMPPLLLTDLSRAVVASDVVVAGHLPGVPQVDAGFGPVADDPRAARAEHELGALMARLHRVAGPVFGYPRAATGLQGRTWPEAFGRVVEALLDDARRWGTPVPEDRVRAAVDRARPALAAVTRPVLVHTDLWPGNLFVDPATGALVGLIDPERALWGDPLLDVAGADQMGRGPVPAGLLAGYAAAGGRLDLDDPAARTRLTLYRVLFSLLMRVEMGPRGYVGDWVDAHRATLEGNLLHGLDLLEETAQHRTDRP